jgi:hypothetical protein
MKIIATDGFEFRFTDAVDAFVFDEKDSAMSTFHGAPMKGVDIVAEFEEAYVYVELKDYDDPSIYDVLGAVTDNEKNSRQDSFNGNLKQTGSEGGKKIRPGFARRSSGPDVEQVFEVAKLAKLVLAARTAPPGVNAPRQSRSSKRRSRATARNRSSALLDGKAPSRDPQARPTACCWWPPATHWHKAMPFLFERIDDYTELLMPDDLLSGNSILASTREAMTAGRLPGRRGHRLALPVLHLREEGRGLRGLKKNKKITPENIPAATQLFTPHWIVRYLVENSLGRLWLLNRPARSSRADGLLHRPEEPETDFLRIGKPEEIKICDPACGSGHMLTYAFDLLYAIYEEEGYEPAEIPG